MALKVAKDQEEARNVFEEAVARYKGSAKALDGLSEQQLVVRRNGPSELVAKPELKKPEQNLAILLEDGVDENYLKLAEKTGVIDNPSILKQKLLAFLRDNGYGIYEYDRVEKYINGLVDKINELRQRTSRNSDWCIWQWKPLRNQDVEREPNRTINMNMPVYSSLQTAMTFGTSVTSSVSTPIYDKPIPMPVLETVADIAEKLPTAKFYVTDYVDVKPDPFLAVKLPGMAELLVIERWDEPSFR